MAYAILIDGLGWMLKVQTPSGQWVRLDTLCDSKQQAEGLLITWGYTLTTP